MTKPREFWIVPVEEWEEDSGLYWGDVFTEHPRQGPLVWQESFINVREVSKEYDAIVAEMVKFLEDSKGYVVPVKSANKLISKYNAFMKGREG